VVGSFVRFRARRLDLHDDASFSDRVTLKPALNQQHAFFGAVLGDRRPAFACRLRRDDGFGFDDSSTLARAASSPGARRALPLTNCSSIGIGTPGSVASTDKRLPRSASRMRCRRA